jgi:hypothetical protein
MDSPPKLLDVNNETAAARLPLRLKVILAVIGVIVVGFVMLHLFTGSGLKHHGH